MEAIEKFNSESYKIISEHIGFQGDIKRYIQAAKHNATDKELRSGMDVNKNFIACLSQDLFGNAIALIKNENFISFANKKIISLAELKDFVSTLYYMKY